MSLPFLTGTISQQASAGGATPICYDGVYDVGKVGNYCIHFDGVNDYVDIPIGAISGSSGSIAMWVNIDALDSTGTFAEAILGISKSSTNQTLLEFYVENSTGLATYIGVTSQSDDMAVNLTTGSGSITHSTWYHIVLTGNSTEAKLYLNGSLVATDSVVNGWLDTLITDGADTARLGGLSYSATIPTFDGSIDEFAIYDTVLSAANVTSLYNGGSGTASTNVLSSNLVVNYSFEEGPGNSTITDRSSNSYNGTLTNADAGDPC